MDRRAAREQRFRWFLLRLAEATRRWVGAERTLWRRFDRLAQSQTGVEAVAGWNGTLFVRDQVPEQVGAVGEAEHRGAVRGPAELRMLRWTLATLLHECIHFAVPMRHRWTRAARAYATWSGVLLEEGVTETATQRLLPQLLAGMERWLPGGSAGERPTAATSTRTSCRRRESSSRSSSSSPACTVAWIRPSGASTGVSRMSRTGDDAPFERTLAHADFVRAVETLP
ncbi:MAG: hypothetical protein WAM30_04690, partial [Candidatus Dormiibacterota bacterium]